MVGRLAPGYLADLLVLDRDIFAEPPEALLERLVRAEGRTMLIATHSASVADRADRRMELHDGELIR